MKNWLWCLIVLIAAGSLATAQDTPPPQTGEVEITAPPVPVMEPGTLDKDKNIRIDIPHKIIQEPSYHASTQVELRGTDPNGVNLGVGASFETGRIDAELQNIYGQAHFRSRLEKYRRLIHRPPTAPTPDSP